MATVEVHLKIEAEGKHHIHRGVIVKPSRENLRIIYFKSSLVINYPMENVASWKEWKDTDGEE